MRELPRLLLTCVLLGFPLTSGAADPGVPGDSPPLFGTGRVYVGAAFGLRMPLVAGDPVTRELILQVAGPIGVRSARFGLEWWGAVGPDYESRYRLFGNGESRGREIRLSFLPGARALLRVRHRFLVHADAGLGPIWVFTSGTTRYTHGDQETRLVSSDTRYGAVFRVAVGAVIPATERLRFTFTPFAFQGYRGIERRGGLSPQLAIAYALN
jgi:hypothetical protein